MSGPNVAALLRHIASEEALRSTQKALSLTREEIRQTLEQLAAKLDKDVGSRTAGATHPRLRLYSDGAARGNPGPAGAGAVLVEPSGQVVDRLGQFLGVPTHKLPEYPRAA